MSRVARLMIANVMCVMGGGVRAIGFTFLQQITSLGQLQLPSNLSFANLSSSISGPQTVHTKIDQTYKSNKLTAFPLRKQGTFRLNHHPNQQAHDPYTLNPKPLNP